MPRERTTGHFAELDFTGFWSESDYFLENYTEEDAYAGEDEARFEQQ